MQFEKVLEKSLLDKVMDTNRQIMNDNKLIACTYAREFDDYIIKFTDLTKRHKNIHLRTFNDGLNILLEFGKKYSSIELHGLYTRKQKSDLYVLLAKVDHKSLEFDKKNITYIYNQSYDSTAMIFLYDDCDYIFNLPKNTIFDFDCVYDKGKQYLYLLRGKKIISFFHCRDYINSITNYVDGNNSGFHIATDKGEYTIQLYDFMKKYENNLPKLLTS